MEGTHWTFFFMKDNKVFWFDSNGGHPDKFLVQYLVKPITFKNFLLSKQ